MLDYLRQKYDEYFEVVGKIGQSWGALGGRWTAPPVGTGGDNEFLVIGIDTERDYQFYDSYYSVWILPQYREFLSGIIGQTLHDYRFFVEINKDGVNPDSLTKSIIPEDIHNHISEDGTLIRSKIIILAKEAVV